MARNKEQNSGNTESTEATEASQAEATTEAEKPAGPTPEELQANLQSAVGTALSTADAEGKLTEDAAAALQLAYRKIPAARRGSVQAEILRSAMGADGVNPKAVASVLEEMTKAPEAKARATRAPKPEVPAHVSLAQALSGLDIARLTLLEGVEDEIVAQATALAQANLDSGIEDESTRDSILNAAAKAARAVTVKARKGGGGGGPRTPKTETLVDLVNRGDLSAGQELKAGDRVATVTADGKLVVNGKECDNPTAAAKEAGVTTSVNGWAFWNYTDGEGKSHPVGDLRKQ